MTMGYSPMPALVQWHDPLIGLDLPTEAEIAHARDLRRRLVVVDRRDQRWGRTALGLAATMVLCASINMVVYAGVVVSLLGHSRAATVVTTALGFVGTFGLFVASSVNVVVLWRAGTRVGARARNHPAMLFGPRLPDQVVEQRALVSSPGLAVALVVDAASTIRAERVSEILGMPLDMSQAWLAELLRRGLVKGMFGGTVSITSLGVQTLDRVLGAPA